MDHGNIVMHWWVGNRANLVAIYALILNRHGMLSSQWAAIFAPDTLMQVRRPLHTRECHYYDLHSHTLMV